MPEHCDWCGQDNPLCLVTTPGKIADDGVSITEGRLLALCEECYETYRDGGKQDGP